MGFLRRIKGLLSGKTPAMRAFQIPLATPLPRRGAREVLQAYRENAWLQSCINLVADGVAAPRWRAFKRVAKDSRMSVRDPGLALAGPEVRRREMKALREAHQLIEVPEHEILQLLARPNEEQSGRSVLRLAQQHLDLVGEAFWWIQRNQAKRVCGLIPIPPHTVLFTPTAGRLTYSVSYERIQGEIAASDMLWLKHPDPERPHERGTGLGLGLGDELDSAEYIARSLKSVFARGGLPVSVVAVEGSQDVDAEESAADLKARYEATATGPNAQGRPFFVPGKLSIATVNPDFKSLQTHELQKQLLDFVRQTYNVPPELMGDLSSSNRSTAEAAMYHLAEYAVAPRLEFLRAELVHKLVPLIDPDVILEYEDPRPKNFERTQAILTNAVTAPAFTLNEARELAGFEPLPELDGQFLSGAPGTFKPTAE
jgi:HK97 family phage portal protein